MEEIATVSAVEPGAAVFPSVDIYDRLTTPMTIVLADDGLCASRRDEVRAAMALPHDGLDVARFMRDFVERSTA